MPSSPPLNQLPQSLVGWAMSVFAIDTRSLAAYRIGLGAVLLADCLLRSRDFQMMLAPDGILPPAAVRAYLGHPSHWSLALLHDAAWWNGGVLALEGTAGILLAVGLHTRLATLLGWVAVVSLIRRTVLANNAGDLWLACQLLWALFLPLGSRWSLDCRRSPDAAGDPSASRPPTVVVSIASVAIVLQLAAVYLGAGLAKCNNAWFAGEALPRAISVHDHGTPLGMLVGSLPWLSAPLQRAIPVAELALPLLLLAVPTARVRFGLVLLALGFHTGIWLLMNVGLFAAVGIVAWLPLIPGSAWPAATAAGAPRRLGLPRGPSMMCGIAGCLAVIAFLFQSVAGETAPLPGPLAQATNLVFLPQAWRMFGTVRDQEQWVACRATLADGRLVDPLRAGQRATSGPPAGGFASLPNHRWHRFLWRLPELEARVFGPAAAAAIARDWNARHPPAEQAVKLEIWCGSTQMPDETGTVREALIAAWPPRSTVGVGNLDRFLESRGPAAAGGSWGLAP
jgi:hypothetical protein